MKRTLWYIIENNNIIFIESKELLNIHQDFFDEDLKMTGCGTIILESELPITIQEKIMTVGGVIKDVEEELASNCVRESIKTRMFLGEIEKLKSKLTALKKLEKNND